MATTILMPKRERGTGDPKRVNQTCTEVVLLGSGQRGHSNPGSKIRGAKSGLRILDSENHSPAEEGGGAKSGGQNPGSGFWTRKTTHPRGAKSGAHTATDFGLGKPLTHKREEGGEIRGAKSQLQILESENNHSPTGGKKSGEAKSGLRILDSENHSPTGRQNPREAKFPALLIVDSENHSPTGGGGKIQRGKIRATDFGPGKPLTHGWQNPSYGFGTGKTSHPP